MFEKGQKFPGDANRDRLALYDKHRSMIRGLYDRALQVESLIESLGTGDYMRALKMEMLEKLAGDVRVVANLPKVIAKKHAGMSARGLTIKATDKTATDKIDAALAASSWGALKRKVGFRSKIYGNAILTVRRPEGGAVVVDARDPWTWFPEIDPFNSSKAVAHTFAWLVFQDDDEYLLQEHHAPGKIIRRAHKINAVHQGEARSVVREVEVGPEVNWSTIVGTDDLPEEQDTSVDEPLVVNLQSWTDEETVFGDAMLAGNESLVAEVTGRLSQIATVLDKHADPKLTGPRDSVKKDRNGVPYFNVRDSYLPRDDGEPEYKYLAWEAQLEHAHQELERTISLLCVQCEMSPELLGLNLSRGAGVEATDTLRIRSYNALSAVEDDRAFLSDGVQAMSRLILKLSGERNPKPVTVQFGDALPLSKKEIAELIGAERMAGVVSLQTAVRKANPEMSEEEVAKEVERIRREDLAADIETPGFE